MPTNVVNILGRRTNGQPVAVRCDDVGRIEIIGPGNANPISVDVVTSTPVSYNVTLTVANTEYSQAMPANCRFFEFQARTSADVRFAFVTGRVAGSVAPYNTLKSNDYYSSPVLAQAANPSTLYFASAAAGTIVEVIAWT